jgi:hypothetical protein
MKKTLQIMYWMPRILSILAILFIGMFSLDSFEPGPPLSKQLIGFLIHNIPTAILIIALIVAWKYEWIGGLMFMIIGLGFSPLVFNMNYQMNHSVGTSLMVILVITFPFIVVGGLFILSHFLRKKSDQLRDSI